PPIDQEDFLKTVEAKRTPEIRAELERAGALGVPVEIVFREGMHADLAMLEHADEVRADLIVMAKHARAAISRFLIGSTTERVLRHARCAVLVIPAPEAKRRCRTTTTPARRRACTDPSRRSFTPPTTR